MDKTIYIFEGAGPIFERTQALLGGMVSDASAGVLVGLAGAHSLVRLVPAGGGESTLSQEEWAAKP